MKEDFPKVTADDIGIRLELEHNQQIGIVWGEIIRVGAYKLDAISREITVIELDEPSGHFFELHSDWPGFADVTLSITAHLPGISLEWFDEVEQLQAMQTPITVWCRPEI